MARSNPVTDSNVLKLYTVSDCLGRGSYGAVFKAVRKGDPKAKTVALKRCDAAFRCTHDALRVAREVLLLRQLRHPNIVRLERVYRADGDKDLYLVFEFCDCSLLSAIRGGVLSTEHQRYVALQLLQSVRYLHARGVVHRDVKPANILLNAQDCRLKLADFGEARALAEGAGWMGGAEETQKEAAEMTLDNATMWYKAPEMLCRSRHYGFPVDCWASGCVIGEMMTRRPIFPGQSQNDQLNKVCDGAGVPGGKEDVMSLNSDYAEQMLRAISLREQGRLQDMLGGSALKIPDEAKEVTLRLLVFNPNTRATADDALLMQWFAPENSKIMMERADIGHGLVRWELPPLSAEVGANHYRKALYEKVGLNKQDPPTPSDSPAPPSPVANNPQAPLLASAPAAARPDAGDAPEAPKKCCCVVQ